MKPATLEELAYRACKRERITRDEPSHEELAKMRRLIEWLHPHLPVVPADPDAPVDQDFEAWYTQNAFDFEANPIGGRECGLMRPGWDAALDCIDVKGGALLALVRSKIEAMPIRRGLLGGQRHRYLNREEVLGWFDSALAGLSPARARYVGIGHAASDEAHRAAIHLEQIRKGRSGNEDHVIRTAVALLRTHAALFEATAGKEGSRS